MTSIYLAAPYRQKLHARARRTELQSFDLEVTSSWLDEGYAPTTKAEDLQKPILEEIVGRCWRDMVRADWLLLCDDLEGSSGGMLIEFGFAWAKDMPIILVGKRSNPFQHVLPHIYQPEWDALDLTYQLEDF